MTYVAPTFTKLAKRDSAREFGLEESDLDKNTRSFPILHARHYMATLLWYNDFSYPMISLIMGWTDHTTSMNAVQKSKNKYPYKDWKEHADAIRNEIQEIHKAAKLEHDQARQVQQKIRRYCQS